MGTLICHIWGIRVANLAIDHKNDQTYNWVVIRRVCLRMVNDMVLTILTITTAGDRFN